MIAHFGGRMRNDRAGIGGIDGMLSSKGGRFSVMIPVSLRAASGFTGQIVVVRGMILVGGSIFNEEGGFR